ncbi:hypothetical protein BRADI_2g61463v3 [Brachypodium distachyon]|uniref:Uncharacterized protein n=1 Tax=Brachypodium distachyon TaxID=15368 RepID=A0A2K2DH95_BRADI|nr:hypothetical protein BRADI_2g61463v3 [Brachypodium distachyon]
MGRKLVPSSPRAHHQPHRRLRSLSPDPERARHHAARGAPPRRRRRPSRRRRCLGPSLRRIPGGIHYTVDLISSG